MTEDHSSENGELARLAIADAIGFCDAMNAERKVRDVIAGITAKLNRSNLSASDGYRHAKSLVKAFRILKNLE